jgi:hypothetical protein
VHGHEKRWPCSVLRHELCPIWDLNQGYGTDCLSPILPCAAAEDEVMEERVSNPDVGGVAS